MGTRISSGARHSQEVPFSLHSGEMSSLGETELYPPPSSEEASPATMESVEAT